MPCSPRSPVPEEIVPQTCNGERGKEGGEVICLTISIVWHHDPVPYSKWYGVVKTPHLLVVAVSIISIHFSFQFLGLPGR
jgi:hypothetical protein